MSAHAAVPLLAAMLRHRTDYRVDHGVCMALFFLSLVMTIGRICMPY
jgi:hypothetical protein